MLEPFDQWDIQPFGKLKPIPYTARFSLAEYETIKKGFIPNCMEDKWVIFSPPIHSFSIGVGQGRLYIAWIFLKDRTRLMSKMLMWTRLCVKRQ